MSALKSYFKLIHHPSLNDTYRQRLIMKIGLLGGSERELEHLASHNWVAIKSLAQRNPDKANDVFRQVQRDYKEADLCSALAFVSDIDVLIGTVLNPSNLQSVKAAAIRSLAKQGVFKPSLLSQNHCPDTTSALVEMVASSQNNHFDPTVARFLMDALSNEMRTVLACKVFVGLTKFADDPVSIASHIIAKNSDHSLIFGAAFGLNLCGKSDRAFEIIRTLKPSYASLRAMLAMIPRSTIQMKTITDCIVKGDGYKDTHTPHIAHTMPVDPQLEQAYWHLFYHFPQAELFAAANLIDINRNSVIDVIWTKVACGEPCSSASLLHFSTDNPQAIWVNYLNENPYDYRVAQAIVEGGMYQIGKMFFEKMIGNCLAFVRPKAVASACECLRPKDAISMINPNSDLESVKNVDEEFVAHLATTYTDLTPLF